MEKMQAQQEELESNYQELFDECLGGVILKPVETCAGDKATTQLTHPASNFVMASQSQEVFSTHAFR